MTPAWALGLWLGGLAWAGDVWVQPSADELTAGAPGLVWVAVADDVGLPGPRPTVTADGGIVTTAELPGPPGVWPFAVVPTSGGAHVTLTVQVDGKPRTFRLPVARPAASPLRIEADDAADAARGAVSVLVRGESLPAPEDLEVASSEGGVVRVSAHPLGLLVELRTDTSPYARYLTIGAVDRRGGQPTWAVLPLRAKIRIPIQAEPGASATVTVGGREYGPWTARDDGSMSGFVEQYPDERDARIRLRDALGNETELTQPLATLTRPVLVALPGAQRSPFGLAAPIHLRGTDAQGNPWRAEPPRCRTPQRGDLKVIASSAGAWSVPIDVAARDASLELRVRCNLADAAQADIGVPVGQGVPVQLVARVWPEVLSTDFPVADLQFLLQDAVGNTLDFVGQLEVESQFGFVSLGGRAGPVARAQYQGEVAAEVGEDTIVARWTAPAGEGAPAWLDLAPVDVPRAGVATLRARLLDAARRPLPDAEVMIDAGAGVGSSITDARGYVTVNLPVPEGGGALPLRVSTAGFTQRALVLRGASAPSSVTAPDLEVRLPIQVDPGRVAVVDVAVSPEVVEVPTREAADIEVKLLDRSGNFADPGDTTLSVSAGSLLRVPGVADGALRWQYRPPPGFKARDVEITARSELLDLESSATVRVQPWPASGYLGVSGGVHSNFGALTTPMLSIDGGGRIRLRPGAVSEQSHTRLFLVGDAGWLSEREDIALEDGVDGRVRMDMFPSTLGLALRQEYPRFSFWAAVGGQVIGWWSTTTYEGRVWSASGGVMPPALAARAGVGLRVIGGELVVELRGSSANTGPVDSAVTGFVGGLSVLAGYRLLFR